MPNRKIDLSKAVEAPLWKRDARDLSFEELLEKKKGQRSRHKERKKENTPLLTHSEYLAYVDTYLSSGFTKEEAKWLVDAGIFPLSEEGIELIEHRRTRVDVYVKSFGLTREEAIKKCASDLKRHNRKRGNTADFTISENLVGI